jgi:hypothetical protein
MFCLHNEMQFAQKDTSWYTVRIGEALLPLIIMISIFSAKMVLVNINDHQPIYVFGPLSLQLKGSGCHYNSIYNNTGTK